MKKILLLCVILSVLAGCVHKDADRKGLSVDTVNTVSYARGFSLDIGENTTLVSVRNPWQHATGIEFKYIFSDTLRSSYIIDEYSAAIKTPVQKVICLSTTHLGFIEYIHRSGTVTGISGSEYIVNEFVRQGISANRIFDVGYDENLDFETIIRLKPDVVFAYGVNISITNTIRKLNELGIPVILIGEYLEQDPLGKMEWLKVFGACYGLNDSVSQQFDAAVRRYNKFKALGSAGELKPTVLLGLPWRGTWYVSGANSYVAKLIKDAGGKYIWDNLNYNESRPLELEKIYEKALTADFWINPGEARSKSDILQVDERFTSLPSIENGKLFNNDNRLTPYGGNDFYETGVVEPDIILSDLVYILNPQLLPSHKLKYYRKLQ